MTRKTAAKSLVTRAIDSAPAPTNRGWFERLDDGARAQLDELKRAHKAGQVGGTRNWLREFINRELGLQLTKTAIDNWYQKP
jgi:hypothetical protein